MQQLAVHIKSCAKGAAFDPATLNAFTGDQIFWVNDDTGTYQPAAVNPDGTNTPMVDSVGPDDTSNIFSPSPLFDSSGNPIFYTINYICAKHPDSPTLKAKIVVSPNP